jgi:hypothetical protein
MRKLLMLTMALGALIALSVAGSASAERAVSGNLEINVDGGFSPKVLSKKKLTPISLTAKGTIKTLDGSHPPALKEFLLESDKNATINVKGFPTCTSGKLQSTDTAHAEKACKSAIIGKGTTDVEIEFAESKPVLVHSKLLVINGGFRGGVTTLFIHAYITVPTPAAIVTTVKIKKIHKGRFGLLSTASIPKIAGGAGSVTGFSLKINKKYTFKGKKMSILSAKCPDGKLEAHGTAVFKDGTRLSADFVKPCTGRG